MRLYAVLLSIVFAIVFVAQILGFIGFYTAPIVIPATVVVAILAYIAYQRYGVSWFETLSPSESQSKWLRNSILFICMMLVTVVFLQRMVLWHQSTLGAIISPDFGAYHSVKAYQLLRDGSAWNLAIPYGQYPFGYESLIAFFMFFVDDIRVTGTVHALIFLLFWLTIALLIVRYSQLPLDASLLIALAICFTPIVFPQSLNIGKNDIFLSLTVLMAILHAPVGSEHFHPMGLAFATMLSLATKATGLYILFYLWGLVMLNWGLRFRDGTWQDYLQPITFLLTLVVMFPGGLWVIRNFLILGELFTSEINSFFQTSIFANLDNPALYNSPSSSTLLLVLIVVLVLSVISLFYRRLGWQMSGTLLVITVTFAITPLSAFLTANNLNYLDVQWRFVVHGIVILWIVAVAILAPVIRFLYERVSSQEVLSIIASAGVIAAGFGLIFVLGIDDLFGQNPAQWEKMLDPSLQENSIYDEIATLEEGTIYIENTNWLAILARNPDLRITELRYPLGHADVYPVPDVDYIAFIPVFTDEPTGLIFNETDWELIFDNDTGRLYQRR